MLARSVKDATADEGQAPIGAFVVLNDLSARDTQWREYRHGIFGPLGKTETFASAMSAEMVTADEVLPRIAHLGASVRVNGETWSETSTEGIRHSLGAIVSHASEGEQLHAANCSRQGRCPTGGLELGRWLAPGERVELGIERIGTLTNQVGERGAATATES